MRSGSRVVTVLTAFLLAFQVLTFAQSATTSLRGVVSDAKGLVIADASVTLSSGATGFSRSTKTDSQGAYQFLEVPPADYVLTIEAPGFAKIRRENVVLQVSSPSTLNVTLQVKGGSVVVDVSGEAPMVNTQDATLGNNFNARQLIDLPSEGRDPVAILSLQPGVTYIGNTTNDQQMSDSRGGAVNGARSDQTNITLDGLDDNDQLEGFAFEGAMRTTLDSLQEFRVTTGNYDADSGRSSGAQVNLVTKSGTNKIHGSFYEYYRPNFTVANDWFNKESEISTGEPNVPGFVLRNTFGATIGGPIKKDRAFFFLAYEGQRTSDQAQETREVPTPSLTQGFLKYICDPYVKGPPASGDPNCILGDPNSNGVTVDPGGNTFPGFNVATLTPAQVQSLDTNCQSNGTCPATPGNPMGGGPNGYVVNINGIGNPSALFTKYPPPNSTSEGDLLNDAAYTFPGADPVRHATYIAKFDYKINASGSHSLFVRGNLQNDHENQPPQFPNQPPFDVLTNNSKGIAAGYTALLKPNLINNFRYAFIRQGLGIGGINSQDYVNFRGLDDTQALASPTILTNVPVHNFVDDVSWTKGKHTIQFGTNWRLIHNNRQSNADNISTSQANLYWLNPSFIANEGVSLDPSINPVFPLVDTNFGTSYSFAAMDVAGILSETFTEANQNKFGQQIPNGQLVPRHFQNFEGEMYLQDKWNVTPNLVLTYGVRYSLLQPPFENTGNQVAPTTNMDQWFQTRGAQAALGNVVQPDLTFALSGQANGGKPYWAWDYKNLAPRLAVAYSPHAGSGFWHTVFGDAGKSSIRAGYGIYFDHFGEGVVNTFDRNGSWGLTSTFSNPAGVSTVDTSPRYTGLLGLANLPAGEIAPSPSGFPYTPPNNPNTYGLAIAWGIDDHLRTPYSEVIDFSITREFSHNFVLETTYTGRFGRRLLQEVDLAQPLNLVDPKSGTTYFQAADIFSKNAAAGTPINNIQPIRYWEDMFPQAAGQNLLSGGSGATFGTIPCAPGTAPANATATQNEYDNFYCFAGNETTAQEITDVFCYPSCAGTGPGGTYYGPGDPYSYYQDQFSSLYAWQTRSASNYNALQVTLRHAMSAGLQFDLNYVYSKSIDVSSNAERVNGFEAQGGVAFNNQAINAWSPDLWRAPSDFDTTHSMNFNTIWDIPYGKGRRWNSSNGFMNSVFGGWGLSALGRWTSGFPFTVSAGSGWSTNFELEGSSFLIGPKPKTGVYINSSGIPNAFQNADSIQCYCPYAPSGTGPILFRDTYPGEAGQRNIFRGPGFFDIDGALNKTWVFREDKMIRFSWEVFNVTNSVRFDAANAVDNEDLVDITSFGNFQRTLTTPRVMQFSMRFAF
jgi:hypothetical protein